MEGFDTGIEISDGWGEGLVKDKDSEFSMVGQERIRTYYDENGNTTQTHPHENRFGVVERENDSMIIEATSLPTYLDYQGLDPFNDLDYGLYDKKNHFRVAGLIHVKL